MSIVPTAAVLFRNRPILLATTFSWCNLFNSSSPLHSLNLISFSVGLPRKYTKHQKNRKTHPKTLSDNHSRSLRPTLSTLSSSLFFLILGQSGPREQGVFNTLFTFRGTMTSQNFPIENPSHTTLPPDRSSSLSPDGTPPKANVQRYICKYHRRTDTKRMREIAIERC